MEFILFTLICALAVASISAFNRDSRILRALRGAERLAIASAGNRSAKLVGELQLFDAPLVAPLTGRRCAYYVAVVEEFDGEDWRRIIQESRGVPFLLEDPSGIAVVLPDDAQAVLASEVHARSGRLEHATAAERNFLRKHEGRRPSTSSASSSGSPSLTRRLRFSEAVLEAGDQVAVLGLCMEEPNPEAVAAPLGGYRSLTTCTRVYGSSEFPLRLSNEPSCL